MNEARKKEIIVESKHLKEKYAILNKKANEQHENGNHCEAWRLLAEMTGVLAEEAKISIELMNG